jgi:hypothetical protein
MFHTGLAEFFDAEGKASAAISKAMLNGKIRFAFYFLYALKKLRILRKLRKLNLF